MLEVSISEVCLAFEKAGLGTAAQNDGHEKERDRPGQNSERNVVAVQPAARPRIERLKTKNGAELSLHPALDLSCDPFDARVLPWRGRPAGTGPV